MSQLTLNSSGTPYVVVITMTGQFYNNTTNAFELHNSSNWEDYALSGVQIGSSQIWHTTFPATITTGTYDIVQFRQGGATPLETDTAEANGSFYWDATSGVLLLVEPCGAQLIYGAVFVDHNYGGVDNLQILDDDGEVQSDVIIRIFTSDNYNAGNRGLDYVAAEDTTGHDGRWLRGVFLPPDTYIMTFTKTGHYLKTREIEVI